MALAFAGYSCGFSTVTLARIAAHMAKMDGPRCWNSWLP